MVKSPKDVELIAGTCAFLRAGCGPVGEGVFTVPQDRLKLGPVLVAALKRRMLSLLKAQDLPGYRALLNQQHMLLRGMNRDAVEPFLEMDCEDVEDPKPTSSDGESSVVRTFFHQNGFRSVREIDSGGWSIACIFKNNEAAKLLLSAKARVASRMFVRGPFNCAAHANNTEAIQILCQAGCSPAQTNAFGVSVMDGAAYHGALEAMDELLSQSTASALNPTSALYNAAVGGGSADVVHRLLEMRANVNAQTDEHWKRTAMIRTLYKVKVLQHRLGKVTMVSKILYHAKGATPLMIALLTGQHLGFGVPCFSTLLGTRADLTPVNSRGWTAADFLQGHSAPEFLREAFEGRMEACQRVSQLSRMLPELVWHAFSDLEGNLSAGNQSHSHSSSPGPGKGLRVANQTNSANGSLEITEAAFPILEAHPLLPPNVSVHMEAGTSPSNFTPVPSFKSASGWVGCWYYGCRGSYHPEFYCQCNSGCTRCGWQRPPPDSRRRRSRRRRAPAPPPPPQWQPSPPPSNNGNGRGLVTAFHQTSPKACKLIVASAFRPGSDGHCGGAIYFAMSPEATKTKAIGNDSQSGCVIEAKVDVGRVKYESANCGHKWNKQEFLGTGYDSIRFDPGDGEEVVIFDSWRVKSMRIIPYNNAWRKLLQGPALQILSGVWVWTETGKVRSFTLSAPLDPLSTRKTSWRF
eukprot:s8152_g2.t3